MSFANQEGDLNTKPIDKTKLLFDKNLRGSDNARLRELLLGESSRNGDTDTANLMEPLLEDGGVVFDYTPDIAVTFVTSYTPMEVVHSNYDFQSFSRANISNITLTAKLTSETIEQADKTLAILHFLRTFSKMNFGLDDDQRGLPPRILRLFAYGDYMIHDVPVAITNFTIALPQDVDYVQTSNNTQVPLVMQPQMTFVIMPTPSKIKREFSHRSFTSGKTVKKGYL